MFPLMGFRYGAAPECDGAPTNIPGSHSHSMATMCRRRRWPSIEQMTCKSEDARPYATWRFTTWPFRGDPLLSRTITATLARELSRHGAPGYLVKQLTWAHR